MRFPKTLLLLVAAALPMFPQQPLPPPDNPTAALVSALSGKWTGFLEYRDYSEPATSTKRVQLPTWLAIADTPKGVTFDYIYDDGPGKTVREHHSVALDLKQNTYKVLDGDGAGETYAIAGGDKLKNGHGELIMTGEGKDADKPAEFRTTWTVRRNLLTWLEEVRPAKSGEAFSFRHRYTFVRADPPPVTTAK